MSGSFAAIEPLLRARGAGRRCRWCDERAGWRDAPSAGGARRGRAGGLQRGADERGGGAIPTCAGRAVGVGAVAGVDAGAEQEERRATFQRCAYRGLECLRRALAESEGRGQQKQ